MKLSIKSIARVMSLSTQPIIKRALGKPTQATCRFCRKKMRRRELVHECLSCGLKVRIVDCYGEADVEVLKKGDY